MGSSEPGRSLSSGISIPQWMKNKINDRYDIDETFSPPIHDDTFFYIRYPKSNSTRSSETRQLVEDPVVNSTGPDFSQHTIPCKQYIPSAPMSTEIKGPTLSKPSSQRVKLQDDEISGESGACGKSVVDVAKQMISGKSIIRGFSVAGSNDTLNVPSGNPDPSKRRGSKSLPASPLGTPSQSPTSSPQVNRKVAHPNRFFTGTYQIIEKNGLSEESGSNFSNWMWPGFLGNRDHMSSKALTIKEEDHSGERPSNVESGKKELVNGRIHPIHVNALSTDKPINSSTAFGNQIYENQNGIKLQPKPSELREMNFWSPTSM